MHKNEIIDAIIEEEGGWKYTDHPADPDQGTFAGVRYITYKNYIQTDITPEQFKEFATANSVVMRETIYAIYAQDYYDKIRLNKLPEPIRQMVMSCGVNCGTYQAIKCLQKTNNFFRDHPIAEDGIIGPSTIDAVSENFEGGFDYDEQMFINQFVEQWMKRYFSILNSTNYVFMHGWYNRANKYRRY